MPLTTKQILITSPRVGFTLFEVAISLVIVTVGVVSALMLMPVGLKAQQMARFQILASAKAIEIMSVNANQWRKWDEQRLEGQSLGLCSINQIAQTPLVEQKGCNWRHGGLPVPVEIARRLESDNDEIQQLVNEGAYLFYSSPRPIASTAEANPVLEDRAVGNESQRLVYAVVGYAQQPALASHPCKAWPYYDWYPTPPRMRSTMGSSTPNSRHEDSWKLNIWSAVSAFNAVTAAWKIASTPKTPAKADVVAYRDRAKELVIAIGGMNPDGDGIPGIPSGDAFTKVDAWKVLAAGYVGQAMVWLTNPAFTPTSIEITQAQKAHEASLVWLRRHVTTDPYDWGVDRALNFQNGWDHPLLQYELFPAGASKPGPGLATPYLVSNTTLGSGPGCIDDQSWRILSAQPVINAGTSSSYGITSFMAGPPAPGVAPRPNGNQAEIAASWGPQSPTLVDGFNLTNSFQPMERCRQLVFWAVDWKSYQDAESAPSAPQDASRLPYDSNGSVAYNAGAHKFNNPERYFTFKDNSRTGFGESISDRSIYLGIWGADRNGNGQFDVGPVPPSVRMRATTVARFNFYQPRVWAGLRN